MENLFLSQDERRIWVTMPASSNCVCREKRILDLGDLRHISLLLQVIYPPAH